MNKITLTTTLTVESARARAHTHTHPHPHTHTHTHTHTHQSAFTVVCRTDCWMHRPPVNPNRKMPADCKQTPAPKSEIQPATSNRHQFDKSTDTTVFALVEHTSPGFSLAPARGLVFQDFTLIAWSLHKCTVKKIDCRLSACTFGQ